MIIYFCIFQGQTLSIVDFIQLFYGQSTSVNQLLEPLRGFIRERVLEGNEINDENLDRAADRFISEIQPYLDMSVVSILMGFLYHISVQHLFISFRLQFFCIRI